MEECEENENEGTLKRVRMAIEENDEVQERVRVMRGVGATMQG